MQLTGEAEFNEVELDEVFVPDDQLVGAPGEGWRVAGSTLSHERGVNPRQLVIHMQHLEELLAAGRGRGAFDDVRLRRQLAQAYVEVRLFQLHNWRSLSKLQRGLEPGPEGSILKLYWSEMSKRLHELALDVLGPAAPLWRGGARQSRRRIVAAGVALLSGVVDLRRHERDPAQCDRANACSALPREPEPGPGAGDREVAVPQKEADPWRSRGETGGALRGRRARGRLTMNRPGVANAQNSALIDGSTPRSTGPTPTTTCGSWSSPARASTSAAGHDLKAIVGRGRRRTGRDMRDTPEGKFRHEQIMYVGRCREIHDFRKPTIAAVQGKCVAAGLMLACMCDLIVAADDALVLQSGAAHDGCRRRAAGRAVGAWHPPGEGVPPRRRGDRRRTKRGASASSTRSSPAPSSWHAPWSWPGASRWYPPSPPRS